MKHLVLCDDGNPEFVLPLCEKYKLGIEIQGFYKPNEFDKKIEKISYYKSLLPADIYKSFHATFADLCLGSATKEIVDATKKYFQYAYDVSKELGVKQITVHHGYVPNTSYIPNWIKRAVVFWNEFLKDKDTLIEFDMENQLEFTPDIVNEIVNQVGKQNLALNLDIGHAYCNSKTSVIEWIKTCGNNIKYVHLHNNHGDSDEHLGINKGTMNILEVLNVLNEYSPNAVWALECHLEDMEESILFLKAHNFI